ncbi:MAG: NmrA/HSCARG family protein [Gammaproteobacteria bacterium]|nr:NmrA/HSCARG family protein [Gammaproteobacteria bacterium]
MTRDPNKRFGGFEGKLLIIISLAMIASIGFMAWFSEPPGQSQASQTSKEPLTILVAGATGRQGGAVVDQLLERGHVVRGMTRKPDSTKAQRVAEKGIAVVEGDYAVPESLLAAMDGVDGVFFYTAFSPNELMYGKNVLKAAKAAGVKHLIYSLGAAADPDTGIAGSMAGQIETMIRESGIPYTIVRPVAFMENYRGQQKRITRTGIVDSRAPDRIATMIAVRDIGFFVGEAFDHPDEWLGRAENISGDQMTMEELAATFSRVVGQEIPYNRMPLEEYLAMLPKPLRPLFRWYEEVGYSADTPGWRERYPDLMTVEDYLIETGWQGWRPPE